VDRYRHTQRGTVMLVSFGFSVVFVLAVFFWAGRGAPQVHSILIAVGVAVVLLLAILSWYFSSMTVVVTDDELMWRFGAGRGWRIFRKDIDGVQIAPHHWAGGYGIRWFGPDRWVYIVSGRETVEVCLKGGGWRRLGTDDSSGLLAALTTQGR
jgi:hypothetical protein